MVLRGGENVYCAEVENALFSHSEVIECIVFSVPDERLGEVVSLVTAIGVAEVGEPPFGTRYTNQSVSVPPGIQVRSVLVEEMLNAFKYSG